MEQKDYSQKFQNIQSIKELNLSNKLISVDLSNNIIQSMDGIRPLKDLRILKLSGNNIQNIDVIDCINLQTLYLDFNVIKKIENISSLSKLQKLSLNNNKLTSMIGLSSLNELKDLNLSFNMIEKIQGLPFPNKIENLELNDNNIFKIDDKTFEYTNQLQRLDLSNNQIKKAQWCIKLKLLSWLNLSKNQIEKFDLDGQNEFLETLLISDNLIQEIRKIHKNFPNLQIIDLSNNQLFCEYELKFVKKLKELFEINFNNNPFVSEEVTQEFIQNNEQLDIVNNIEVNKPGDFQNKQIKEIKELQADLSENQQYSSQFDDYIENQDIYTKNQGLEGKYNELNDYLVQQSDKIFEIRNQFNAVYSRREREQVISKSCNHSIRDDSSTQSYKTDMLQSQDIFKTKLNLKPVKSKKISDINLKTFKKQNDMNALNLMMKNSKTTNLQEVTKKKSFLSTINSIIGTEKNNIKLPSIRPVSRN